MGQLKDKSEGVSLGKEHCSLRQEWKRKDGREQG